MVTPRETLTLAIVFADIAKSTHLYETLGDGMAQNLVSRCLSLLSHVTAKYRGTVIKTIGDEIMCTFPTANAAVEAAIDMHQAIEEIPVPDMPGFPPPNIYVGIQWGAVIQEGNDVFGDAVNVAAHMAALAKPRQIITTEKTVKVLTPEHQAFALCIDEATLKGKSGEFKIYEMIWERHDVTVMVKDSIDAMIPKSRIELRFYDRRVEVDRDRPSATLGRQSHNDVVIDENRVSRSHACIEYRRGKFVLIDQSTNGTFVLVKGKRSINLRRDEAQLLGNGIISLGREVDPDAPTAIHYTIKL